MAPQRQTQQRRTRTQRRAEERAQPRSRAPKRQSGLPSTLIGGAVTVVIVAAILVYVIYKNSTTSSANGINILADYNPLPNQIAVGQPAPNFTLKTASGKKYTLSKQQGHPVLLEFFAVWCPICQGEAPTIARITKKYVPKGVRVWSILSSPYGQNYDKSNRTDLSPVRASDLSWFASTFDVTHPQLVDRTFGTVNKYGISAYPGIYVIDKKGKVVFSEATPAPYSTLSSALNKALKGTG